MIQRSIAGQLTKEEKHIAKAMLKKGGRNQDIQALLNLGRVNTINSARITEVKKDLNLNAASDDELQAFKLRKLSFDPQTGLNAIEDERLVRAREAMILAVQIFNSAALNFKSEVFLVLCNIAWTYLFHDFYLKNGVKIVDKDGRSLLLSQILKRQDCPLSKGQLNNLKAISLMRDQVEHKLLGKSDVAWQGLFQACCLNFDEVLCKLYGSQVTLASNLSFSLQFAKPDLHQLALVSKYLVPPEVQAIDARLSEMFSEEDKQDLSYQFRVVYTLDAASKGSANLEFVKPDSAQGKEIRSVLVNYKSTDHVYPFKPSQVCQFVEKATTKRFTSHNHQQAWLLYKVRPKGKVTSPELTDKSFCIYHPAHGDYTYSQKWVDHLIVVVNDQLEFSKIKSVKLG